MLLLLLLLELLVGCRVPSIFGMPVRFRVGLTACCRGCFMLGIVMVPLAVASMQTKLSVR